MTKTEMRKRARSVRAQLAQFVDLQNPALEGIFADNPVQAEYNAMNALLFAQKDLSALIRDLRTSGYGEMWKNSES